MAEGQGLPGEVEKIHKVSKYLGAFVSIDSLTSQLDELLGDEEKLEAKRPV